MERAIHSQSFSSIPSPRLQPTMLVHPVENRVMGVGVTLFIIGIFKENGCGKLKT